MNLDQAHDAYLEHIDQPYGTDFVATVGRFQEGFLHDRVTDDIDEAFRRAVETAVKLVPAMKAKLALRGELSRIDALRAA